jgi:hypothetical protein
MAGKCVNFISKVLKNFLDRNLSSNYNKGLSIFYFGMALTGKAVCYGT